MDILGVLNSSHASLDRQYQSGKEDLRWPAVPSHQCVLV